MGDYFLWGDSNGHAVYQHWSGLDYMYFLDNKWWVGPEVGKRRAGLLNTDGARCPHQVRMGLVRGNTLIFSYTD